MKKLLIGGLIALNVFSIEFFYSFNQQSKNIGFCGSALKDSQEHDSIYQLFYSSDEDHNKKILKGYARDFLKEVVGELSESKNIAAIFTLPETRLHTAYISVSSSKIPEFLLKDRLFKPPKIS